MAVGQTSYESGKEDQRVLDIIYESVEKAFLGIPLTLDQIEFIATSGNDILDGRSISDATLVEAAGAHHKDDERVVADGSYSALYAYMRILSGAANTALVVAGGKSSELSMHQFSNLILDPFFQRPIGLDAISAAALQARRYMDKFGITQQQVAKVAVKNRKNGMNNPYAQVGGDFTVEDVLNSPPLALPLRRLDVCPVSDGACAIIMASEEFARKITPTPAWIKGVGCCTDSFYLGFRELSESVSCQVAAKKAYAMAGITDPVHEIDIAEIHETFSFHELMLYEALGFCAPGEGGGLIDQRTTEMDGQLPVNTSGGALCANPMLATGLVRIAEAGLQVMGLAGDHQLPNVQIALAHGTTGLCLQSNCVFVLGRDK